MYKTILLNILAVLVGVVLGSAVNTAIVMQGNLPEGVTMQNLAESMHLFQFKHYVFPFLGHAIGTLAGALVAGFIAFSHKMKFALLIGFLFLIGGILNVRMLHYPFVPALIDLLFAYIPMGFLGGKTALAFSKK